MARKAAVLMVALVEPALHVGKQARLLERHIYLATVRGISLQRFSGRKPADLRGRCRKENRR